MSAVLLVALLVHPRGAYAAPGDPAVGSPSGSVYELPFERGRADAAPKSTGGTAATTGSNSDGSFYRSENNFGSSSEVPGVDAEGGQRQREADGGSPEDGAAGGAPAGGDSGPGGDGGGGFAANVTDAGNTSPTAAIALLAAILVFAIGAGLLTARSRITR